ncbi:MAG: hypothetical protein U0414_28800 [Polyangiaceae bacterium]
MRPLRSVFLAVACLAIPSVIGCGAGSIPDPKEAALAFAAAAKKGDADALYEMLSAKGKRTLTREDVKRIVGDEKAELADQAKSLTQPSITVKSEARVKFADGEEASRAVERDGYKITAADALPAAADTPAQALGDLRRVLARRSYPGLVRVLSPTMRAAIEDYVRSLVEGLENPEGLDIQVSGDNGVVDLPGGHRVRLKRAEGKWHIEDVE